MRRRRRDDFYATLVVAGFVLLVIFQSIAWYNGRQDCSDRGGDWVRGTFWYVCTNEED